VTHSKQTQTDPRTDQHSTYVVLRDAVPNSTHPQAVLWAANNDVLSI